MLADDQTYGSWMASVALAVLMALVMVWIRSQIPDDAPVEAASVQTAAAPAAAAAGGDSASPSKTAIASIYECVSGGQLASSDSPCSGPGAVLSQIGSKEHLIEGDTGVLHHR
jgi:hypothetical protein